MTRNTRILVTGASGFLGQRVVAALRNQAAEVVALVRSSSNTEKLRQLGATIHVGDITDLESVLAAAENVSVIVHAAADTDGTAVAGKAVTLGGTRNVLEACRQLGVGKLVYISSCSVYDFASARPGQHLQEDYSLEPRAHERGPYTQYKLAAELEVSNARNTLETSVVILRPGAIYGPGTELFPAMLGFAVKRRLFVVIGMGHMCPPWTFVDNVAEAICCSIQSDAANGQIFNVVDEPPVSKRVYIDTLIRTLFPSARVVYVPYAIIMAATSVQELLFAIIRREPFLTRYRLKSSQRNVLIDGSKIRNTLDWQPSLDFHFAVRNWNDD